MTAYVAGPQQLRDKALALAGRLKELGYAVTSRWLYDDVPAADVARACLDDVRAADVLLLLNPESWGDKGTGGRHVEFGYALALGKQVAILGSVTNDFHRLPGVRVIERLEDL